jgi:nucleotide-binding universal stress UspA family protein
MASAYAYKDILVMLSAGDGASARLEAAIALARDHGARLTGLDVSAPGVFSGPRAERAAGLYDDFQERLRLGGVSGTFRSVDRSSAGGESKALQTHHADLVIAPTPSEAAAGIVLSQVPEDVLLASGRPMLVFPELRPEGPLAQKIVVAWNATREATRALHDALPLLTRAQAVTLFAFHQRARMIGEEIALMLDHLVAHGVKAEKFTWPDTGEIDAVDALFSCLSEQGADMIVAGGYGHRRMFEHMFGGVTATLIDNLTVPVLLSH